MPTEARTNPPGDEERMPLIARPQPPSIPSSEARGGLSAAAALSNVTHLASSIISPQQTSTAPSTLQSTANAALASAAHAASNLVASHTSSPAPAGGSKPAQTASAALNNVAALIAPAPAASSSAYVPPPAPTTSTLAASVVPELVALAANTVANKPTTSASGAQTTPATIAASVAPQVVSLASNAITNLSTPSSTAPASASSAAVASVASIATSLLNPNPSASFGTSYANYGSINASLPVSSNAAYVEPVAAFQPDAANSYASTKTFAKGFLDLSLLTSNLSLLKIYAYNAHAQSRIMMLILIIISISINVASALMSLILFFQKPDGDDIDATPTRGVKWRHYGKHTQRINTALAVLALVSIVINAVITAFANTKTITP